MITVVEHNKIEAVEEIRDDWHRLLAETPRATFFHTPDWLEAYWQFFATDQQLRILVIRDEQHIIGIMPLVVRHLPTKIGEFKLLTYPLHDWGEFYSPIGSDQAAILQAACYYLQKSARKWNLFEPRWVDDDGLQQGDTFSAMQQTGMSPHVSEWSTTAIIEFTGTIEEYWGNWSSKNRSEQRRNENRLARNGELNFIRHRPEPEGDPRWDLYADCKQVARESWQGKSTTGTTLSHESVEGYLEHLHGVAARMGCLDVNLLYQDDEPIAFAYGYHYRGHVDGSRIGFVRSKKTNGAGRVLIARMIADSFERGDCLLNMGSGKYGWKQLWQTQAVTTFRYTSFATHSLRAQACKINRWMQTSWQQLRSSTGMESQQSDSITKQNSEQKGSSHNAPQLSRGQS